MDPVNLAETWNKPIVLKSQRECTTEVPAGGTSLCHPELQRLGDVIGDDTLRVIEIGNRPRDLPHAIVGAALRSRAFCSLSGTVDWRCRAQRLEHFGFQDVR